MREITLNLLQMFVGFSGGFVVGGGFVAFITVLKIIPRLVQLSKTNRLIKVYIASIVLGLMFGTILSFYPGNWHTPLILLTIFGVLHGIFNGMLAAALAEILHVFPVLLKRMKVDGFLLWLLMAIMFGKIIGSLFQWLIFVKI